MTLLHTAQSRISALIEAGGPVVMLLLVLSVVAIAITIYKLAFYWRQGVGRHHTSRSALALWSAGQQDEAMHLLARRGTIMAQILYDTMQGRHSGTDPQVLRERIAARVEARFGRLQSGFRLLDSIAQIAPLLGLFGTVLGMIDAFRALQDAGSSVDPSVLAGGIWVALLTTAVGLAVAMPSSLILTWLEARVEGERLFADEAVEEVLSPNALGEQSAGLRHAA